MGRSTIEPWVAIALVAVLGRLPWPLALTLGVIYVGFRCWLGWHLASRTSGEGS